MTSRPNEKPAKAKVSVPHRFNVNLTVVDGRAGIRLTAASRALLKSRLDEGAAEGVDITTQEDGVIELIFVRIDNELVSAVARELKVPDDEVMVDGVLNELVAKRLKEIRAEFRDRFGRLKSMHLDPVDGQVVLRKKTPMPVKKAESQEAAPPAAPAESVPAGHEPDEIPVVIKAEETSSTVDLDKAQEDEDSSAAATTDGSGEDDSGNSEDGQQAEDSDASGDVGKSPIQIKLEEGQIERADEEAALAAAGESGPTSPEVESLLVELAQARQMYKGAESSGGQASAYLVGEKKTKVGKLEQQLIDLNVSKERITRAGRISDNGGKVNLGLEKARETLALRERQAAMEPVKDEPDSTGGEVRNLNSPSPTPATAKPASPAATGFAADVADWLEDGDAADEAAKAREEAKAREAKAREEVTQNGEEGDDTPTSLEEDSSAAAASGSAEAGKAAETPGAGGNGEEVKEELATQEVEKELSPKVAAKIEALEKELEELQGQKERLDHVNERSRNDIWQNRNESLCGDIERVKSQIEKAKAEGGKKKKGRRWLSPSTWRQG